MIQGTKIFRVTISGGKIDNFKASDYKDFDISKLSTSDKDAMLNNAIAQTRFKKLAMDLQHGLDFMGDFDNTVESGSYKSIPSSLSFTLSYTQPDGLYVYVDEEVEEGEDVVKLRNGKTIFKNKKALEKIIVDSLNSTYSSIVSYYKCETVTTKSGSELRGWTMEKMEIPAVSPSVEITEILPTE